MPGVWGFFTLREKKKMVLLWMQLNRSGRETPGKRKVEVQKKYICFGLAQNASMFSVRKENTDVCSSKKPHL